MARKLNGIELTRYDDLFKTDAEREADQQERVQIVPAEQVFPYARQPYSVDRPSADLVRLMDSIERTGIAEPLIVRPRSEGGYEIISGHRRDYCAKGWRSALGTSGLDSRHSRRQAGSRRCKSKWAAMWESMRWTAIPAWSMPPWRNWPSRNADRSERGRISGHNWRDEGFSLHRKR